MSLHSDRSADTLPRPPAPSRSWAYFLDFDGTLVELAATPGAVEVHDALRRALRDLWRRTGGATAIISGRSVASVDALLAPLRLAVAGQHGAELRIELDRPPERPAVSAPLSDGEKALLRDCARRFPGVLVEEKGAGAALHYREAPAAAEACRELVHRLAAAAPSFRAVQPGKMVFELKLAAGHKGEAVRRLMQRAPFAGRRPVFVGDDVTDEDGFRAVLDLGGLAVRVGAGTPDSVASHALADSAAVLQWLAEAGQESGAVLPAKAP
jgi:trehalose 6-phosphate phosphatase